MKIVYKGFKVSQDPGNHHVSIFNREGKRVFHSQASEKKTIDELKNTVDFYLMLFKMAGGNAEEIKEKKYV